MNETSLIEEVFPAYPEYKKAVGAWLETVPTHWEERDLKHKSDVIPSNIDKKSKDGEKQVWVCNYMDVYKNEFITADLEFLKATASDKQIDKLTLLKGDVILTKDSEDYNDIAIPALVKEDMKRTVCGYHLTLIRPHHDLDGGYLFRLLQADVFNTHFKVMAKGVTRFGLSTDAFTKLKILLPPLSEQRQIAYFLDHKTAQIDAAIEKGRRLIELLREERAALINEAVTAGVDEHGRPRSKPTQLPAEGWKDSGVEWLGVVPTHWEERDLKHKSDVIPSNIDKKSKDGEKQVWVCNYMDVYKNEFITADLEFLKATASDKQIDKLTLLKGDVILTKDSEDYNDIAIPALVKEDMKRTVCGYHLTLIRPHHDLDGGYLFRLLQADVFNTHFKVMAKGVTRFGLSTDAFTKLKILLPPLSEQHRIVEYIETETTRIDQEISILEREIELLAEYRQALISEAVTGKIDVREVEVDG